MENETKKFYQSTTIQGGIIQLLVFLDLMFQWEIGSETINQWIVGIMGIIGTTMVIIGRIKARYNIKTL